MIKKIISSAIIAVLSLTIISTSFAYDLSSGEKDKGDKVVSKILFLINTRPEEKRVAIKEKLVVQLEGMKEKARKNDKLAALIGYVIDKVKSSNGEGVISRYPGCNKDDLVLSNGQVWSACDVGSITAGDSGEQFAWGSMFGYKDANSISDKKGSANDWNDKDTQGPCRNDYHVPSKSEFEKAIVATNNIGGIGKTLDLTNGYWTTTFFRSGHYYGFVGKKFSNQSNTDFLNIRCIKD